MVIEKGLMCCGETRKFERAPGLWPLNSSLSSVETQAGSESVYRKQQLERPGDLPPDPQGRQCSAGTPHLATCSGQAEQQ